MTSNNIIINATACIFSRSSNYREALLLCCQQDRNAMKQYMWEELPTHLTTTHHPKAIYRDMTGMESKIGIEISNRIHFFTVPSPFGVDQLSNTFHYIICLPLSICGTPNIKMQLAGHNEIRILIRVRIILLPTHTLSINSVI